MPPIDLEQIGYINPDLEVLKYKNWTISRIAPQLYYYRCNTAASFASGMTPEDRIFPTERDALIAALEDIERMIEKASRR